jgi:hypothetical protein
VTVTQPLPTALDQLLLKLLAFAGVPAPTRQYLNFLSGATYVDNPNFQVNGEMVGSTDVSIQGSYTPPVHNWADSTGGAVDTGVQTNMVQVSFTPATYTSARVAITGIIENASTSIAALFLLSVGLAIAPALPSVVYTGDDNGLVVPKEVSEVLGTVQFAMVYTAHGLVPGTTYTICAFGEAAGVNLAVAAHGVQIDVSEVAS